MVSRSAILKLHVGCGSVYLRDWVNIDIPTPGTFLASERPDLVEKWITTDDRYYGRHQDKTQEGMTRGPLKQETVCDVYGSFALLPAITGSVSEVLSRQVFEHLDRQQVRDAIEQCRRVLRRGGIMRIDIPDPDETLRLYRKTGDEFYIRHLFGPRRDVYGSHVHYTRKMLIDLVEDALFRFASEETNIHFYPAFCLRFERI